MTIPTGSYMYIENCFIFDCSLSGASSVYYNLHRLSRLFKDQVAYPLLSFMRAGKIQSRT